MLVTADCRGRSSSRFTEPFQTAASIQTVGSTALQDDCARTLMASAATLKLAKCPVAKLGEADPAHMSVGATDSAAATAGTTAGRPQGAPQLLGDLFVDRYAELGDSSALAHDVHPDIEQVSRLAHINHLRFQGGRGVRQPAVESKCLGASAL